MRIATWNVNSIRARATSVLGWLSRCEPDVLCMQETKVEDDDFPTDEFLRLGYAVLTSGQKSYNGVAIASRLPVSDVAMGLLDDPDDTQKRVIRATISGMRVYSVYVPNGKSPNNPAFQEKLRFFSRLRETVARELESTSAVAICGDFNVAPHERDVPDPDAMRGQLHFHPDEHRALASLMSVGLVDVFRMHHTENRRYSWWDYRAGSFRRNIGLRIDFILASAWLASACTSADIDVAPRREEKASDHTPVMATFHER